MINYYICSIGEPGKEYDHANLGQCVLNSGYLLHQGCKQKGDIDKIEEDDILILKYQNDFIAYGRAISSSVNSGMEGWSIKIPVMGWISGGSVSKRGIKDAQLEGNNYQAVKHVDRKFAKEKIAQIGVPL